MLNKTTLSETARLRCGEALSKAEACFLWRRDANVKGTAGCAPRIMRCNQSAEVNWPAVRSVKAESSSRKIHEAVLGCLHGAGV